MKRRLFIKGSMAGTAIGAGLLAPQSVLAAWPKAVMESSEAGDAGSANSAIKIKAPEIAENGAVVPVTVDATAVDGVKSITIVAASNQRPIAATYHMKEGAVAFVSTRLKMGKTGEVYGVVNSGAGASHAKTQVKVTIGGCGG